MSSETGESQIYETKSGRKIEYTPKHRDFLDSTRGEYTNLEAISNYVDSASTLVSGGYENISSDVKDSARDVEWNMSLWAYSHRFAHSCTMLEILKQAPIKRKFKKMLDLGCGYGVQPAVLRGIGAVDEAYGIDIVDRASALRSDKLKKLHKKMRYLRFVDSYIEGLEDKESEDLSPLQRVIAKKIQTPRQTVYRSSGIVLPQTIYNYKMVAEPKLDGFWEMDIFKHEGQYDLITAFSCVEWFDSKELFKKISELLAPGGIFYMYVANWWGGNSAVRANGPIPYALQRLNGEDRDQYVNDFFPGTVEQVHNLYEYYDPGQPTFKDYVESGFEAGMVPVAHRMAAAPMKYSQKRGISTFGYAIDDNARFREALSDIRTFRPDVGPADLVSNMTYLAFMRVDENARATSETYDKALKDVNVHYRPTGGLGKLIRNVGMKVLFK